MKQSQALDEIKYVYPKFDDELNYAVGIFVELGQP